MPPASFVVDGLLSPEYVCSIFVKYQVAIIACSHLEVFCFVPLINMSGFVLGHYFYFYYYGSVICHET